MSQLGRHGDAVDALTKGHALGSARKDWPFASKRWLDEAVAARDQSGKR